ncbi:phage virion morphogenesis protein [Shewanella algae]|uniref:phage virion morphogenesis protein n=1 Tax=Shewanella algae TaxID=38313 RepID=UPI0031F52A16
MSMFIRSPDIKDAELELALLAMPAKKRQRALWRIANGVKKASIRNAKRQQDPDGSPWPKRKKARDKRKMLTKLPAALAINDKIQDVVEIYLPRSLGGKSRFHTGVIASMHEDGHKFRVQADVHKKRMAKLATFRRMTGPATKKQARLLRQLGFRRQGKKGKYVKATASWIVENISYKQAGLLIGKLIGNEPKESWTIDLPKRKFLGVSPKEANAIFKRVMQGINYGWQVKKQDMRG